jgi:hypothetical protein
MNEKDFETLCDELAKWDAPEEKGEFCPNVGEFRVIETNCQPGWKKSKGNHSLGIGRTRKESNGSLI